MEFSLNKLESQYSYAFENCKIRSDVSQPLKGIAAKLVELRSHYKAIEKAASVPWWFAGILHYKEWQFREPKRFEQQVIQVLRAKKFDKAKTRTVAAYLWGFDLWNGFRDGSGRRSTWVWEGTNVLGQRGDEIGAGTILAYLKVQGIVKIAKSKPAKPSILLNYDHTPAPQPSKPASEPAPKPVATPAPSTAVNSKSKKLPVKFFSQLDNAADAHRTCNTSSCWMGAMYMRSELWKKSGQDGNADYHFYLPKVQQYGDTTDHNAQTRALSELGIESEWRTTLSIEDVKAELDQERPVVLGTLHKGHSSSPGGFGHMILAVGYDETGLLIHDPYGEMDLVNGGYPPGSDLNGEYRHYSYKNLRPRFEVGGAGNGWGRIFKGKPQ